MVIELMPFPILNFIPPQNKFLATPLTNATCCTKSYTNNGYDTESCKVVEHKHVAAQSFCLCCLKQQLGKLVEVEHYNTHKIQVWHT